MIDAILKRKVEKSRNDAQALRNSARELRDKARYETSPEQQKIDVKEITRLFDAAVTELLKAITETERGLRAARRQQAGYSTDVCELLAILSQTYGSLGGTRRDAGDYPGAMKYYDLGNEHEEERRTNCGHQDTYNMLQRQVVRLLDNPKKLEDDDFLADLNAVREEIQRETQTGRSDSWALADLALTRFLCGMDADEVMPRLEAGQAAPPFYVSTYNLVKTLVAEGLGRGTLLGARLEEFQRQLQRKGGLA